MKPVFKVDRGEKLYIDKDYVSNGHWLVPKARIGYRWPQALRKLLVLREGRYALGMSGGVFADPPDLRPFIPKREGYEPISREPLGVELQGSEVKVYVYAAGAFKVGVQPRYVPLLEMGRGFAKDATSPLLVLDGETINDELLAVLMPMKLKGE